MHFFLNIKLHFVLLIKKIKVTILSFKLKLKYLLSDFICIKYQIPNEV